jgi:hypothetical protein
MRLTLTRLLTCQMLNQLRLRIHAEAFEDYRKVIAHRAWADEELFGDRGHSLASQYPIQDL